MVQDQRQLYEAAVIERMKESGFLEIEIRVECLVRCGDGYQDEVINAGWHYWNAAIATKPSPSMHPVTAEAEHIKSRVQEVEEAIARGARPVGKKFSLRSNDTPSPQTQTPMFVTGWDIAGDYSPPDKIFVNGLTYVPENPSPSNHVKGEAE